MSLEKPIVVFGTGRSGTTVFHRMLSTHRSVSWLSTLCNRTPQRPELNRLLMSSLQHPVLGRMAERRWPPSEAYHFWEHYCKGFSQPCRDLRSDDLSTRSKKSVEAALQRCVAASRPRLLLKITGWPRLGFLSSLLKDAKFVHVFRDGRAVANSLVNVDWWWGWRGPSNWRWGPLPDAFEAEWEESERSFIVLAAIQWKMHMEAAEATERLLSADNLFKVRYESLCEDPVAIMREIARFAQLDWTPAFEQRLRIFRLQSANDKWKSALNDVQKRDLQRSLGDTLLRYEYE